MGKKKCVEKKGTANDPKYTASGTGPLNFTNDLMYDDSSKINLEGSKPYCLPIFKKMPPDSLGSAPYCFRTMTQNTLPGFIGKCSILHQDNDPKHSASSGKEFIRVKKWKVLDSTQSPDLNLIEHEFHQMKRRVKAKTPQNMQQLELAALKAGKSISKDETKSLVMSMGHRLTAVIVLLNNSF